MKKLIFAIGIIILIIAFATGSIIQIANPASEDNIVNTQITLPAVSNTSCFQQPLSESRYPTELNKCLSEKELYLRSSKEAWGNYDSILELKRKYESWIIQCDEYEPPVCPEDWFTISLSCTGSMLPNFHCNFEPRLYKAKRDDIRVCDVIWFSAPGSSLFHRIIEINDTHYITKGDNSLTIDKYQPTFVDVRGKVCYK